MVDDPTHGVDAALFQGTRVVAFFVDAGLGRGALGVGTAAH